MAIKAQTREVWRHTFMGGETLDYRGAGSSRELGGRVQQEKSLRKGWRHHFRKRPERSRLTSKPGGGGKKLQARPERETGGGTTWMDKTGKARGRSTEARKTPQTFTRRGETIKQTERNQDRVGSDSLKNKRRIWIWTHGSQ